MQWEWLIFPLIAFGIWLLSTILRAAEQEPSKGNRRQREDDAPSKQNRSPSDLDRFLQESRRRREEKGAERQERAARAAQAEGQRRQQPQQQRRPARPMPEPARQAPRRSVVDNPATPPPALVQPTKLVMFDLVPESASTGPPSRRLEPATAPPLAVPVAVPVPAPALSANPATTRASETVPEVPMQAAAPPPIPQMRGRHPSPVLVLVNALLRKPHSAGIAFVLREIFDPPLSRRRRFG